MDLARVAVENIFNPENSSDSKILDVIGPETFTWKEYVTLINKTLKTKTLILPFPGKLVYLPIFISKLLNIWLKDRLLTIEEINSLKDNLCFTNSKPLGNLSLTTWLKKNNKNLGLIWTNEVKRHYN